MPLECDDLVSRKVNWPLPLRRAGWVGFRLTAKLPLSLTKPTCRRSLRMLCHGGTFLSSYSNKNIMTCQKINKISFLCDTKKVILFFVDHNFFTFSFYVTHCQQIDLPQSGPGNKETYNPSFTHLSDISKQFVTKTCSWKKVSYHLGLRFIKCLRGVHILKKS